MDFNQLARIYNLKKEKKKKRNEQTQLRVAVNWSRYKTTFNWNKTLGSVHFGVVVVELIKCKCGGIVTNEIW